MIDYTVLNPLAIISQGHIATLLPGGASSLHWRTWLKKIALPFAAPLSHLLMVR